MLLIRKFPLVSPACVGVTWAPSGIETLCLPKVQYLLYQCT